MQDKIIALDHCCIYIFYNNVYENLLNKSFRILIGDNKINVYIHEDNYVVLIMAETLPPQFTPQINHYSSKTVQFFEEIHKRGVKLKKITAMEQLGDFLLRASKIWVRISL